MKMNKKGFTLIELLIVVAIIAILAAIAIPQFSAYRIRGFNSAAIADCRNGRTASEAFFSDWQVYASSAAAGAPGAGVVWINTANTTGAIAALSISATAPSALIAAPGFSTGVSANDGVVINTQALGASFTIGCKNSAGDRCIGMDSDTSAAYWVNGNLGAALTAASAPVATAVNDFMPGGVGVAGAGVCNGGPAAGAGQITWTTL